MFRTVLILKSTPEDAQKVMDHYAEFEVMAEGIRQAGALECELCVSVDDPGDFIVTSLWPDEAAYQTWIDHPVRAKVTVDILDYMPVMSGKVYRVEDRVTRKSLGLD